MRCGAGAVAVSGAVSGPSLDLGKNNSTSPETAETGQSEGPGRYDCRQTYSNFYFEADAARDGEDEPPTAAYRCNSWECYCCGYRMRQNLVEEIERITTQRPELSRMLTLTLDPARAPDDQGEQHYYITERWNALRTRLKREIGDFSYIWVREEQENGYPHLHVLVSRYLPQSEVEAAWDRAGMGDIVDIQRVEARKAGHYIAKYLAKDAMAHLPSGVHRYGSSADIELGVRGGSNDDDTAWMLEAEDRATGVVTEARPGDFIRRPPPESG